jgi:hypothetical protein
MKAREGGIRLATSALVKPTRDCHLIVGCQRDLITALITAPITASSQGWRRLLHRIGQLANGLALPGLVALGLAAPG